MNNCAKHTSPASLTSWMNFALDQARLAASIGEVPVGAIVVYEGEIIASTHNQPIRLNDPSAHAEVLAIRLAAQKLGNYRLPSCKLFVTLEPCIMCVGVILQARLSHVFYATTDPKTGAAGSVTNLFADRRLNHHTQVEGGILAKESAEILRSFFTERRVAKKETSAPPSIVGQTKEYRV